MRTSARACLFSAALALALTVGCGGQKGKVLGKAPSGKIYNIIAVRAGDTPRSLSLSGAIVEKCPVAGCWFYLQDETGTIKVDTKAAGFVVVDLPLQTKVTVSGQVLSDSEDVSLQATGLRY
jgi:uncharacterized protein YdeI (BOF family)